MPPFDKLSSLYETMCEQTGDDGSFNRQEIQYLTASSLTEKFKSFENRICEVRIRENSVMKKGKQLGALVDNKLVYELMGYRDPTTRND